MQLDGQTIKKPIIRVMDFFLPPRCTHCGVKVQQSAALCGACWGELHHITAPQCKCCGHPFDFNEGTGALCGACIKKAPSYNWARAPLAYNDMSQPVVLALKHGKRLENAAMIANMLKSAGGERLQAADMLVPIPLHPTRLFKRRFNQSASIAQHVSKGTGVPVDLMNLTRTRATTPQVSLNRKQRLKNVRGAFAVINPSHFEDKFVILIDDVFTTGATVEAAAKTLKKAGAREIGVLTFARRLNSR